MRFSEILLLATTVSGAVWALDSLFLRPRRMMYVVSPTKGKAEHEPWWVEYSKSFFPVLLIVLILRSFLIEPFRIPSGSMRPTLKEGDFIIVNKYDYGLRLPLLGNKIFSLGDPQRGDIIVFKHDKKGDSMDMIKRVIGLPNDRIQYKDKMLYVNGELIQQDFLKEMLDTEEAGNVAAVRVYQEELGNKKHLIYVQSGDMQSLARYLYDDVVVPPNQYFVMGDNRDNSGDSRFWGFVRDEEVQGRAFAIWMSWDSAKHRIRWDRLTLHLQ